MFFVVLKEYLLSTSLHGLRFIVEKERHWSERVFWLCCVVLSWCGSAYIILESVHNFNENPISFGVETTYLDWATDFPSVIICERQNPEHYMEVIRNYYPERQEDIQMEDFVNEIVFFDGTLYQVNSLCRRPDYECPRNGYSQMSQMFLSDCEDYFQFCYWNNVQFDCCTYFHELQTEIGLCYAINNCNTKLQKTMDLKSNLTTGPGELVIAVNAQESVVYPLPKGEVPHMNLDFSKQAKVTMGLETSIRIKVNDIFNDHRVRNIAISKRRCRFPDENNVQVYGLYSPGACLVNCRMLRMLQLCNCTLHTTPNLDPEKECDLMGLQCLEQYATAWKVRLTPWALKTPLQGVSCDCMESCINSDVEMVLTTMENLNSDIAYAKVTIALDHLPTERFKRLVVRGNLDLVVSMGGAAGLFMGASVLSFVEFLYYFTVRLWITVSMKGRRQREVHLSQQTTTTQNVPKEHPRMLMSHQEVITAAATNRRNPTVQGFRPY